MSLNRLSFLAAVLLTCAAECASAAISLNLGFCTFRTGPKSDPSEYLVKLDRESLVLPYLKLKIRLDDIKADRQESIGKLPSFDFLAANTPDIFRRVTNSVTNAIERGLDLTEQEAVELRIYLTSPLMYDPLQSSAKVLGMWRKEFVAEAMQRHPRRDIVDFQTNFSSGLIVLQAYDYRYGTAHAVSAALEFLRNVRSTNFNYQSLLPSLVNVVISASQLDPKRGVARDPDALRRFVNVLSHSRQLQRFISGYALARVLGLLIPAIQKLPSSYQWKDKQVFLDNLFLLVSGHLIAHETSLFYTPEFSNLSPRERLREQDKALRLSVHNSIKPALAYFHEQGQEQYVRVLSDAWRRLSDEDWVEDKSYAPPQAPSFSTWTKPSAN